MMLTKSVTPESGVVVRFSLGKGAPRRLLQERIARLSLTASAVSTTLHILTWSPRGAERGEFFAETHLSTESAPPSQDARLSHTHEDSRGPQGTGGAPQKRTSSSYAYLKIRMARSRVFHAPCAYCDASITKLYMAQANAARALSLQFSSARSKRFGASLQPKSPRRATPKPGPM